VTLAPKPLSFHAVDGLGFAAATGQSAAARAVAPYVPTDLGPLLEMLHLAAGCRLPDPPEGGNWLATNRAASLIAALGEQREFWVKPQDRRIGFIPSRAQRA
jgi:hypothetical protein